LTTPPWTRPPVDPQKVVPTYWMVAGDGSVRETVDGPL